VPEECSLTITQIIFRNQLPLSVAPEVFYGHYCLKPIVPQAAGNATTSFLTNLKVFLTGCAFIQFSIGIYGFQMESHILGSCLKQFSNLRLGQPYCFLCKAAMNAGAPVLGLIENEFTGFGDNGVFLFFMSVAFVGALLAAPAFGVDVVAALILGVV